MRTGSSNPTTSPTPGAKQQSSTQSKQAEYIMKAAVNTHLDNGFAVTSIPRRKEWLTQRKGEASKYLKVFQKMVCAHLQLTKNGGGKRQRGSAGRKGLGEVSCKNHRNKKTATGWTIGVSALVSRYRIKRP